MAIKKEEIKGTKILNEIESANITRSEYDTESKEMIVEFKNGARYIYNEVPHNVYTKFRLSESQGKFFTAEISKKFKYAKLG
jgi:KTSC domain